MPYRLRSCIIPHDANLYIISNVTKTLRTKSQIWQYYELEFILHGPATAQIYFREQITPTRTLSCNTTLITLSLWFESQG